MDPEHDKPAVVLLRKPRQVRGLVAIFDVLGFKSFCQHNTDQRVAEEVLTTIDLVPELMVEYLYHTLVKPTNWDKDRSFFSEVIWLVFSDTILITLPQAEQVRPDLVMLYFVSCAVFNRLMFDRGLPIRGSVHLGDFLLGNRCVAGRVIVEAFDQVHELEAACTVISNDAWAHLHDRFHNDGKWAPFLLGMLPRHSIRCKTGMRTLATLNWFNVSIGKTPDPADLKKYVMDSFLAHGKQLNASAVEKARDTAELFEKFTTRPKPASAGQLPVSGGESQGEAVKGSDS
jgi:hypothetical protein